MTHKPWSNICRKLWSAKLEKTHSFWLDKGQTVKGMRSLAKRAINAVS